MPVGGATGWMMARRQPGLISSADLQPTVIGGTLPPADAGAKVKGPDAPLR
jgi:hypothetical protein